MEKKVDGREDMYNLAWVAKERQLTDFSWASFVLVAK